MVQKLTRQAGPLTKPMLLQQQLAAVACRQIERIPVPDLARNAKPANQVLQAVDRLETRTIGARGTLKPVNFCKLRQRPVDFPQQHRSARCGAAAPRIFTIDNDDVAPCRVRRSATSEPVMPAPTISVSHLRFWPSSGQAGCFEAANHGERPPRRSACSVSSESRTPITKPF